MFKFPVVQSNFLSSYNNPFTVESFDITSKRNSSYMRQRMSGRGKKKKKTKQPVTVDKNPVEGSASGVSHVQPAYALEDRGPATSQQVCGVTNRHFLRKTSIALFPLCCWADPGSTYQTWRWKWTSLSLSIPPYVSLCSSCPHSHCHPDRPASRLTRRSTPGTAVGQVNWSFTWAWLSHREGHKTWIWFLLQLWLCGWGTLINMTSSQLNNVNSFLAIRFPSKLSSVS